MPTVPAVDAARLESSLLGPGRLLTSVRCLAETGSTNADLAAAALDGAPGGLLLTAEHQAQGRGRFTRPWRDTPDPALQKAAPETQRRAPARKAAARKQLGPIDQLLAEIRRDRKGVAVCAMLAATMLVMAAAWGRNMVSGVNTQRSIERYQAQTITLRQENEKLAQQLEIAGSGERIRNLAQNELGMLRRERAQTETIYIQAPDKKAREEAQTVGQTHMEILDFLLGLLNVFHIGE